MFATIIVMPVTYSIANGVGVGIILHTSHELLAGPPGQLPADAVQRILHLVLHPRHDLARDDLQRHGEGTARAGGVRRRLRCGHAMFTALSVTAAGRAK